MAVPLIKIEIEDTSLCVDETKEKINIELELEENDSDLNEIRRIIVEKSKHIQRGNLTSEWLEKEMEKKKN